MIGRTLVGPDLLGRSGQPCGAGAIVPIVDLVAGMRARASVGEDWLATSDVWLHERAPIEGGPLEIESRLLRAGRRVVVLSAEVVAGGRPALTASIEFTRIRRDAALSAETPVDRDRGWIRVGGGPLLDRPLEEACGFRIVDGRAGVVELDRSPYVANSTGTLQGGVVALLADVAAAAVVGPGARTVELQYRFLAPTGDGPARTRTEIVRVDGRHRVIRVEVVDASDDDRLVGVAICGVLAG